MKPRFRITYEVVTPESAEHGDTAENGFVDANGLRWGVLDALEQPDSAIRMDLRTALRLCHPQEDAGLWFCEVDGRIDYTTGAEERRLLHPPHDITPASYERLRRLLKIQ